MKLCGEQILQIGDGWHLVCMYAYKRCMQYI